MNNSPAAYYTTPPLYARRRGRHADVSSLTTTTTTLPPQLITSLHPPYHSFMATSSYMPADDAEAVMMPATLSNPHISPLTCASSASHRISTKLATPGSPLFASSSPVNTIVPPRTPSWIASPVTTSYCHTVPTNNTMLNTGNSSSNSNTLHALNRERSQEACGYNGSNTTTPSTSTIHDNLVTQHSSSPIKTTSAATTTTTAATNNTSSCASKQLAAQSITVNHDPYNPYVISTVIPGLLYLSSGYYINQMASKDNLVDQVRNVPIRYILNVSNDNDIGIPFPRGFTGRYMRIPVDDSPNENLEQYFESAIHFINEAKSNGHAVLVHCAMGISRSATIVLAYLMYTERINLEAAFKKLVRARPIVNPNHGFIMQLIDWQKKLDIQ